MTPEQYLQFADALKFVLKWEGGYSDHPNDPGGQTVYGISRRAWPKWKGWERVDRNEIVLPAHTLPFYRDHFWLPCACDKLPPDYALALFDTAVNIGKGRACKMFQRFLNQEDWAAIRVDGIIGPETIRVACGQEDIFGREIDSFLLLRIAHYVKLARRERYQPFLRGWLNRVVALAEEVKKG